MATRRRRTTKTTGGEAFAIGTAVLIAASVAVAGIKAAAAWAAHHPAAVAVAIAVLLVLLVATGIGTWQVRRGRTERAYALTTNIAATDGMTGLAFEEWTATLMRRTGFTRVSVCGGSDDQGADVIAHAPTGHKIVVQCKRYGADRTIGSPVVHQLNGTAIPVHRADVAAIVTTGRFTGPAVRDAARFGITLIDRTVLAAWATDGIPPSGLRTRRAPR